MHRMISISVSCITRPDAIHADVTCWTHWAGARTHGDILLLWRRRGWALRNWWGLLLCLCMGTLALCGMRSVWDG